MKIKAMSLLEILISTAVLAIALLGLSSSILNSLKLDQENQELTIVSYALREKVEELRAFARLNFESVYAEYGPGSEKEFFPIYSKTDTLEEWSSELFPPSRFRPENGGKWIHSGRIKIVSNEQVTAPDLPMVLHSGTVQPMFKSEGVFPSGSVDISEALAGNQSSDNIKIWYIIVTAVWESPRVQQPHVLTYQTIIGDRLKGF